MADRTIDKTQGLERAQSKVKIIDIVLILLIFFIFSCS